MCTIVGNPGEDSQKGNYDSKKYMVPLKPHQEEKSEYEQPQVSVLSMKVLLANYRMIILY